MGIINESEMLKHRSAAGQGFVSTLVTSPSFGSFITQPVPTCVHGPQALHLPAMFLLSDFPPFVSD